MKIAVVGTGYVGLSLSVLLSQKNEVFALDIDEERVESINKKNSPIKDKEIEDFFQTKKLNLMATTNKSLAYEKSEFIIVATPTNYDEEKNFFDTSTVEGVVEDILKINPDATIVIKSTVPVGFTEKIKHKLECKDIIFSPEFLREGKALYDNLYPSRIVVGGSSPRKEIFANLLKEASLLNEAPVLYVNSTEAEAIKLFANTYLALRVAFFNELDTYAMSNSLNARQIIDGVCLDPRIGSHYNNPSFGYGGYCLPKDTKQLLANYQDIPQDIIGAIVSSNETRKKFIANEILKKKPRLVGVYKLAMKAGSDNFRASSIIDVLRILIDNRVDVLIYEPNFKDYILSGCTLTADINYFKKHSDLIISNRMDKEILDISEKVFTRDIFERD